MNNRKTYSVCGSDASVTQAGNSSLDSWRVGGHTDPRSRTTLGVCDLTLTRLSDSLITIGLASFHCINARLRCCRTIDPHEDRA